MNISMMKEKKMKNIELLMGCVRMICGKYQTWNVNQYEQRTIQVSKANEIP